jgi:hypothetical protein
MNYPKVKYPKVKANWWNYDKKTPVDLNTVRYGEEYFYTGGLGERTGIVTVIGDEPDYGILVEFKSGPYKGEQEIIYPNDTNKKLYNLIPAEPRFQVNELNTVKQKLTQPDAMTYPNVTYPKVPTLQYLAQKSLNSEDRQRLKDMNYDYLNQNPENIPKYPGDIPNYDDNSTHGGRIKSKKSKKNKRTKRTKRTKRNKKSKKLQYK